MPDIIANNLVEIVAGLLLVYVVYHFGIRRFLFERKISQQDEGKKKIRRFEMFENYIEEQKKLLPFVKKQYNKFPELQLPIFRENGNDFIESRIRINTTKWWREIENCAEEIRYAYSFFKGYICLKDMYHEDIESDSFNRAYEILLFEVPFWINSLLSGLFSFREKMAQLIFYLNDSSLTIGESRKKYRLRDISFYNVNNSIKNNKLPDWLSSNDKEVLLKALEEFKSNEVKNLLNIRHAFMHCSSPAIDTIGSGPIIECKGRMNDDECKSQVFEYPQYDSHKIEKEFSQVWEIFRMNTIKISSLDFFQ